MAEAPDKKPGIDLGPFSSLFGLVQQSGRKNAPLFRDLSSDVRAWNDPDILQEEIRDIELVKDSAISRRGNPEAFRVQGDARIAKYNARLDVLEARGVTPSDDFMLDTGVSPDQPVSPVFGTFPLIGAINFRKDAGKWIRAAKEAAAPKPKKKLPARKSVGKKLSLKANRLIGTVRNFANLEITAGRVLGLAKAAGLVFGPAAAAEYGPVVIGKISKVLADRQFAEMERILKQRPPRGIVTGRRMTQVPRIPVTRGPATPRPAAIKATESARPRVAKASLGGTKASAPAPVARLPSAPPPVSQAAGPGLKPVKASTPTISTAPPAPVVFRPKRLVALQNAVRNIENGQRLLARLKARRARAPTGIPIVPPIANLGRVTSPQPLVSRLSSGGSVGSKVQTETCYQVCRKKGGPKKKRAKPRVCLSANVARQAGISSKGTIL